MDYLLALVDNYFTTGYITNAIVLFMYSWLAICMVPAYYAYKIEKLKGPKWFSILLVIIAGFGPLLCAITIQSYISEYKNEDLKWDKTEKMGKVALGG